MGCQTFPWRCLGTHKKVWMALRKWYIGQGCKNKTNSSYTSFVGRDSEKSSRMSSATHKKQGTPVFSTGLSKSIGDRPCVIRQVWDIYTKHAVINSKLQLLFNRVYTIPPTCITHSLVNVYLRYYLHETVIL